MLINKNEYIDIIQFGGVFQKQKEEIDTLYRIFNCVSSFLVNNDEKYNKVVKKEEMEKLGSISTFLYQTVFENYKKRGFPFNSDIEYDIKDFKEKDKTIVHALYKAQETEIENIFRTIIRILTEIKDSNLCRNGIFYLDNFDYIAQYINTNNVYRQDIYMGNYKPFTENKKGKKIKYSVDRLFRLSEDDVKIYNRLTQSFSNLEEVLK